MSSTSRRLAILTGGSGLYLRAALVDLRLPPRVDADTRAACERLYDDQKKCVHWVVVYRKAANLPVGARVSG